MILCDFCLVSCCCYFVRFTVVILGLVPEDEVFPEGFTLSDEGFALDEGLCGGTRLVVLAFTRLSQDIFGFLVKECKENI